MGQSDSFRQPLVNVPRPVPARARLRASLLELHWEFVASLLLTEPLLSIAGTLFPTNARQSALVGGGETSYCVPIVRYTSIAAVAVCWHGSLAAIVKEHQDPKTTSIYARVVDRTLAVDRDR